MAPVMTSRAIKGIGTKRPARDSTIAPIKTPLMTLPNRRMISEKMRVICSTMLSGIITHVGSAKVAR